MIKHNKINVKIEVINFYTLYEEDYFLGSGINFFLN